MKKLIALISSAGVMLSMIWGCSDSKGRYLDLATGQEIEIDKENGIVINEETKEPVYIYVDTKKNDTIYGSTGEVINGHVMMHEGKYMYDADAKVKVDGGEDKVMNDDMKIKVEDDGDTKIKTDDKKIKIDDGEKKVKND